MHALLTGGGRAIFDLNRKSLERYLTDLLGTSVRVTGLAPLGQTLADRDLKGHGYGEPVLIEYRVAGRRERAVLATVRPGGNGHEHMADRAQSLLWAHRAFNEMPGHVRSRDVGGILDRGELVSLAHVAEVFQLQEFAPGEDYHRDLERIRKCAELEPLDLDRADALAECLADLHSRSGEDPCLYHRRLRELLGHGECIMGVTDTYPVPSGFITAELLERIEQSVLRWRWRLKSYTHRLRQVHGDFHPWNILFREGTDFTLLDRSRGEWGEPADDVTCLTINYVFFSLITDGRLHGPLEELFHRFWDSYLEASEDEEILMVAAPFFAFRGLVLASPLWYPDIPESVRRTIIRFVESVLAEEHFEPREIHRYLGD